MYLTKLLIRDFGKFHNKNMDLQPGVNIIYGEDGAGKSTVRDFLVGLIYGIPRRDGITKVGSNYELRKPESGSGYSGTAYLKDDEKTYLVDRTFLAGAKKASVLDVQSGREVNLTYQDTLSGTLIETDKNTFLDTRCIIEKASNSVDNLQDYLTNITLTGTANINKSKAIEYLEKEKKSHVPRPLIRRLDELDKKIAEYDGIDDEIEAVENEIKAVNEEFVIEAERRKRAARQMVENEDGTVTYTYTLRDMTWSDGQPVTAKDYEFAWKRAANEENAFDYGYMFENVVGYPNDLAVTALDDKTLEVTIANQVAYWNELLAFPTFFPVREDVVANEGWNTDPSTYVCNGMYTMDSWEHNSVITLKKNENHPDAAEVTMPTLKFYLSDDANNMLTNFKNGEWKLIDDVPTNEMAALKQDYPDEFVVAGQIGTYYVCWNINEDLRAW